MKTFEKFNMLKAALLNEQFTFMYETSFWSTEEKASILLWDDAKNGIKCDAQISQKDNNLIHLYLRLYTYGEDSPLMNAYFFKAFRIGSIYDYITCDEVDIFINHEKQKLCSKLNVIRNNYNIIIP